MARRVEATREVAAPAEAVWQALDDFPAVARYNPPVATSCTVQSAPAQGVGARRRCDFHTPGMWVEETLVERDPDARTCTVRVDRGTARPPVGDVMLEFRVEAAGPDGCVVHAAIVATPGNLAQRAAVVGAQPVFQRLIHGVLDGLAVHASTGREVATRRDLTR